MPRKPFTVHDANDLIPVLEVVFARIDALKTEARQLFDRLQVLELLWGDRLLEPANPDHAEGAVLREEIETGVGEIERLVREELLGRGLRFPTGGLEHGLVDFPTTWEGRWIYLCWRRGEPALQFWHEVDSGFSGRQPLTSQQVRWVGRGDDPVLPDDSVLDF